VYDPVLAGTLSQPLLHQRVAISEQLHGELVVGGFEQRHQHVAQRRRARSSLLPVVSVEIQHFQPVIAAVLPAANFLIACE